MLADPRHAEPSLQRATSRQEDGGGRRAAVTDLRAVRRRNPAERAKQTAETRLSRASPPGNRCLKSRGPHRHGEPNIGQVKRG